ITVKPHASLFAAALIVLVAVVARRDDRSLAAPLGIFGATIAVGPLAATAWLTAKGALAAWREIVFDYLLPLYSRLGRPDRWPVHWWPVWIPIAAGLALPGGCGL